jgi:hypothetical protein
VTHGAVHNHCYLLTRPDAGTARASPLIVAHLVDRTDVIDERGGARRKQVNAPHPANGYRHGGKTRCLTMTDPYSVLGVSPTATQAEITHAYRRHLRDHHPDIRSRESNSEADERLRQVLEAYALLRDPHRRAAYDRAHPAHQDTGPVPIPVTHNDSAADQPPLSAGPVRRHS